MHLVDPSPDHRTQESSISLRAMASIQSLLEERLQAAYASVAAFQQDIQERQRQGFIPLQDVSDRLRSFCPEIYRLIVDTVLDVIPRVQPESCSKQEPLNLYFWPGYHSFMTNKRIFGHSDAPEESGEGCHRDWHFGTGVCRWPAGGSTHEYSDSSQARWYHYLIRPRNTSAIQPGDIHTWFGHQRPLGRAIGLSSITVSVQPINHDDWGSLWDHIALDLSRVTDTESWGPLFSLVVNSLGPLKDPGWRFPGRKGEAAAASETLAGRRSVMTSLWLTTVFRSSEPPWLEAFIAELAATDEGAAAAEALQMARRDPRAADWADRSSGRPLFASWTNFCLHSSLAPVPPALFPLRRPARQADPEVSRTVGSAAFLSSAPFGPLLVSLLHPWLSAVYGMLRDAEVAILLNNSQIEAASATGMYVGPWFAHELRRLIDDGLQALLRQASESTQSALAHRYFVLNSIQALGNLTYTYASGTLASADDLRTKQRDEFLGAVRSLRARGRVLDALRYVAGQVYGMVARGTGGRVEFATREPEDFDVRHLRPEEHRICLLLVSEAIRSHCHAEDQSCVGRWSAAVAGNEITIELSGACTASQNPASIGFRRLELMFDVLDLGKVESRYSSSNRTCSYLVVLRLPD